jgi:2-polyprenyl-3-methyl-5-hydroxy-6-metoxy-1,4-benzoquinol methylase
MAVLDSLISFLACPDDSNSLYIENNNLKCEFCEKKFRIINENTVELLPTESFEITADDETTKTYTKYYADLQTLGYSQDPKKKLWGIETKTAPEGFVKTLRNFILKNIKNEIVCDVGAGSGDYSLLLAKKSKYVFHCDLDLEAIMAAKESAKKHNLKNILFVHCNYFSLPFKDDSLQNITCIDVLERGREHDKKLIVEISKKLQKTSKVILDFHSKERAKVNKKLDLGGCYSKDEIITILKQSFEITLIVGMGFAPTLNQFPQSLYPILNFLSKKLFPPARWVIIAQKL